MMRIALFALIALVMVLGSVTASAQTTLTNDHVIQMSKAGFDDQTILKAIQAHEPAFDTSVNALLALKTAGVTPPVIQAMLDAQSKPKTPTPQSSPTPEAAKLAMNIAGEEWPAELKGMYREVGIYYKQAGGFVQLYGKPVVGAKTGGFLKSSFTMGLSKIRSKGQVPGKHAQLQVKTRQPIFYFYML